jgi:hypothetical protein
LEIEHYSLKPLSHIYTRSRYIDPAVEALSKKGAQSPEGAPRSVQPSLVGPEEHGVKFADAFDLLS